MTIIGEVKSERNRWVQTTGYSPEFVVLGVKQYKAFKEIAGAIFVESNIQREQLYGMDIIHAANKESCILFGKYADSPCG